MKFFQIKKQKATRKADHGRSAGYQKGKKKLPEKHNIEKYEY